MLPLASAALHTLHDARATWTTFQVACWIVTMSRIKCMDIMRVTGTCVAAVGAEAHVVGVDVLGGLEPRCRRRHCGGPGAAGTQPRRPRPCRRVLPRPGGGRSSHGRRPLQLCCFSAGCLQCDVRVQGPQATPCQTVCLSGPRPYIRDGACAHMLSTCFLRPVRELGELKSTAGACSADSIFVFLFVNEPFGVPRWDFGCKRLSGCV